MRYQVPQFIEVEDKIFGPLTARQFIYLAGGAGIALGALSILPVFFAVALALPFVALSIALAFYQLNGRPFISVLESAFSYLIGKKLYLWSAERKKVPTNVPTIAKAATPLVPKLSESKLRDLSWSLNIKDRELMGVQKNNDFAL